MGKIGMKLAIQEDMLPGRTLAERYANAQALGFAGIECWADGLEDRIVDVATALNDTDLVVASVHLGHRDGYLSPDPEIRESAISYMRESMATAVDLMAEHVTFVPHWGNLITPDLTPHRSAEELASDLMIWLLRTVSDLAYALGTKLHMQPRHRYETQFLNTLTQAVKFSDAIKNNPHIRIAPSLFDLAMEESDIPARLRQHGDRIGYLYLADSNGQLPGQGLIDFTQIASALKDTQYDGWLCISAGHPIHDPDQQYAIYDALPKSLAVLKQAGLF